MRSRPVGPGVGGLYYSPLLQDGHSHVRPGSGHGQPTRHAPAGQRQHLWAAIAGIARRAARRLIDARMAEAQRQIDHAVRSYGLDAAAGRRGAAVRYY